MLESVEAITGQSIPIAHRVIRSRCKCFGRILVQRRRPTSPLVALESANPITRLRAADHWLPIVRTTDEKNTIFGGIRETQVADCSRVPRTDNRMGLHGLSLECDLFLIIVISTTWARAIIDMASKFKSVLY